MKKTLLTVAILGVLTGCATQKSIPPQYEDKEPNLIGLSIQERLDISSKKIDEQEDLLNKINTKKHIGKYSVVEHNNKMDARVGSTNTIPYAYAFKEEINKKNLEDQKMLALLNTRVKAIDWKDNSANELGKNFAISLGYDFVIGGNKKDLKITYTVKNVSLLEAIQQYQKLMEPIATVTIVDSNKTVNVIYK